MTFLESALTILKQNQNQPLTAREIWGMVDEQSLVETIGKTPWATLNTMLLYHTKPEYRQKKYFKIVDNNSPYKYCLLDFNTTNVEIIDEVKVIEKSLLFEVTSKELEWKKLSIYNNADVIEYEITDCGEFTYVMEDKAHATIKIGKTKNNPELRLNQLKTGNPSINLLHVFPSTTYSENELHTKFDDYRKDLEWFFNTKGVKDFIEDEITKQKKRMESYKLKINLDEVEKDMLQS